jgi:hypothetical protein
MAGLLIVIARGAKRAVAIHPDGLLRRPAKRDASQ